MNEYNASYEQLLNTPQWRRFRHRILRRDRNECVRCHSRNRLEVHHVRYRYYTHLRRYAVPWDYPENELLSLCTNCHEQVHRTSSVPVVFIHPNHSAMTSNTFLNRFARIFRNRPTNFAVPESAETVALDTMEPGSPPSEQSVEPVHLPLEANSPVTMGASHHGYSAEVGNSDWRTDQPTGPTRMSSLAQRRIAQLRELAAQSYESLGYRDGLDGMDRSLIPLRTEEMINDFHRAAHSFHVELSGMISELVVERDICAPMGMQDEVRRLETRIREMENAAEVIHAQLNLALNRSGWLASALSTYDLGYRRGMAQRLERLFPR